MISNKEMVSRAEQFVDDFKDAKKENAEMQTFYNEFFNIFGKRRRDVAVYERAVRKLGSSEHDPPNRIDLLWPKVLLVEQKSAGMDLDTADKQAIDYYLALPESLKPRYVMSCNFQKIHLVDLDSNNDYVFYMSELPKKLNLFEFMVSELAYDYEFEEKVSMEASELVAKLHQELSSSKYPESDMSLFLTRLTYCFFAEDTGIFSEKQFLDYIIKHGNDCSILGSKLDELFTTLNKPLDERQSSIEPELAKFPYVDGQMFEQRVETAHFTSKMRDVLINAAKFNWSFVSPIIFGSMFESMMNAEDRRTSGSHYTSEENVLKVINPLFMNALWTEFDKIKAGSRRTIYTSLKKLQTRLSKLKFLDPACGSGSFLIVTYQEIRRLELEIIKTLYESKTLHDSTTLSKIDVDQFYGIEKNDIAVRIAESALWMVDHIMNRELMDVYEGHHIRIPLKKHPNIHCGDALDVEWRKVLNPKKCSYILGNPPFGGIREITSEQNTQLAKIVDYNGGAGMLDYVAAWFIKAARYAADDTTIGFVATNSITQGVQVEQLWPKIHKEKFDIIFAYKKFKWRSELKNNASVIVVIIGLGKGYTGKKTLYDHIDGNIVSTTVNNITPYLEPSVEASASSIIVSRAPKPLNNLPVLRKGMAITDDDNYVFDKKRMREFLDNESAAEPYFRPYVNARSFLHDTPHWVLMVDTIPPSLLSKMPLTNKLIENVKKFRKKSRKENTKNLSETPKKFERPVIPKGSFLVIPVVTSEKREYIPLGMLRRPYIASAATIICESPKDEQFALLSTRMHMLWFKRVGGRLKNDLRYSNIVYNTFPVPDNFIKLRPYCKKILRLRKKYKTSTLAQLYDPNTMPSDLKLLHKKLDRDAEKLYRVKKFTTDDDRVGHLGELYQKLKQKGQERLQ